MNRDFKKVFYSSLLVVLFIISNLIGLKYTNFTGMIVSVNFVTYPFVLLCGLLLVDMFRKKDAYYAIITAIFSQILILFSYVLTVNLGSQGVIPDLANSINKVFDVSWVQILASLIAFIISNYILMYLYDYFKMIGKKLLGVTVGCISSLILYGLIYISISYYSVGIETILNLILGHIIMSVIMTVVITILFYILKDKDNIYDYDNIFVRDINVRLDNAKKLNDKPILEIIERHDAEDKVKKAGGKKAKNSRVKSNKEKNSAKRVNKKVDMTKKRDNKSKKETK